MNVKKVFFTLVLSVASMVASAQMADMDQSTVIAKYGKA